MRFLCFLFLLAFAGAVAAFAYENQQEITLRFLNWSGSYALPVVIGAAYVLGMLSGWTVVGMLRRSFHRATESRDYANAR
jgi:uncharacterized integral membrane protein